MTSQRTCSSLEKFAHKIYDFKTNKNKQKDINKEKKLISLLYLFLPIHHLFLCLSGMEKAAMNHTLHPFVQTTLPANIHCVIGC